MAANQSRNFMLRFLAVTCFLLVVVIGAMVIAPARVRYNRQCEAYEKVCAEVERKRAERNALQQEVSDLKSNPAAIERVARTKFRFCKEGETVLYLR